MLITKKLLLNVASTLCQRWPVDYAVHIYNHLPGSNGQCPADLFTGALIPRRQLKNIHVWGCPVYALDPTLQQGKKLPHWQPRSRQGIFVGYSPLHSSDVPLVLNLQSGSISPQYNCRLISSGLEHSSNLRSRLFCLITICSLLH